MFLSFCVLWYLVSFTPVHSKKKGNWMAGRKTIHQAFHSRQSRGVSRVKHWGKKQPPIPHKAPEMSVHASRETNSAFSRKTWTGKCIVFLSIPTWNPPEKSASISFFSLLATTTTTNELHKWIIISVSFAFLSLLCVRATRGDGEGVSLCPLRSSLSV